MTSAANVRRITATLAILSIATGMWLRFYRLDHKLLFRDEAYSLLRITGHTLADYEPFFDGSVRPAGQVAALLETAPGRGVSATFRSIRTEEPQRGPLYYLIARLWIGIAGDSIAAVRGLSAWLGVLGIGVAYLLGSRVMGGALGGLVLAALFALSPFEVRYSQQIREYVLMSDFVLLTSWLLLRAAAQPRALRWIAYGVSLAFALYASGELAVLFLAHAVWVCSGAADRRSALRGFAFAACVAAAVCLPLLLIERGAAQAAQNGVAWEIGAYPLLSFAIKWAFNAGAAFYDYEFAARQWAALLPAVLVIEVYALLRLATGRSEPSMRALCVGLIACTLVPIVLLDLFVGGHFETTARYQVTTWIGIELAVAAALIAGLSSARAGSRGWACAAFAYLLVCGAFSGIGGSTYAVWWDNNEHISERAVANVVSRARQPLVVASGDDEQESFILVLSRYLDPPTAMLLFRGKLPQLPRRFGATFLFLPSARVRNEAEARWGPHATLRNVSPGIGIVIPDLRGPSSAPLTIAPENTLWRLAPSD